MRALLKGMPIAIRTLNTDVGITPMYPRDPFESEQVCTSLTLAKSPVVAGGGGFLSEDRRRVREHGTHERVTFFAVAMFAVSLAVFWRVLT